MLKQIITASIIINIGLLLGRLLGFFREIIIAQGYGATWQADVTVTVLTLPDILINILVGGALTAALVPSFVADKAQASRLAYQASVSIFVLFLVLALVLAWQSTLLVNLLAPGYTGVTAQQAQTGVSYVVLLLPLFVLTGVTTALLQSREHYAISSLGTFFFNGVLIIGLLLTIQQQHFNTLTLVLVVLAAGAVRYVSQLLAVRPSLNPIGGLSPWLISSDLVRRYWQAMISGGILFVYPVAARAFASYTGEGGVAVFNYAMRLIELPLLICVSFLGIVLLPKLSQAYQQSSDEFVKLLSYGLQAVLVLSIVTFSTLYVGRAGYTNAVYASGLQPQAIAEITQLIAIGLLCVLFQGVVMFITAALNAARKTHIPLMLNVAGGLLLILVLQLKTSLSLLEIMVILTATYSLLAISYLAIVIKQYRLLHQLRVSGAPAFLMAVIALNGLIAILHTQLLDRTSSLLLSVVITLLAGCVALLGSVFCHAELRERFKRVVMHV